MGLGEHIRDEQILPHTEQASIWTVSAYTKCGNTISARTR